MEKEVQYVTEHCSQGKVGAYEYIFILDLK